MTIKAQMESAVQVDGGVGTWPVPHSVWMSGDRTLVVLEVEPGAKNGREIRGRRHLLDGSWRDFATDQRTFLAVWTERPEEA